MSGCPSHSPRCLASHLQGTEMINMDDVGTNLARGDLTLMIDRITNMES